MSESSFSDFEEMWQFVETPFAAVNLIAQRVKQLTNLTPPLVPNSNPNKLVSTAFEEAKHGLLGYEY